MYMTMTYILLATAAADADRVNAAVMMSGHRSYTVLVL